MTEMPTEIPGRYYTYYLSFLQAMAAITSTVTDFDGDLKDAYRQHRERYPFTDDDEDEC